MKKLFYFVLIIVGFFLFNRYVLSDSEQIETITETLEKTEKQILNKENEFVKTEQTSLFIPYWNVPSTTSNISRYDRIIYFGITANENGVVESDEGYTQLNQFSQLGSSVEKLLTLRLLDADTNLEILEDREQQETIITETIDVAEEYDFDGIVLDLEMGGTLPVGDTSEEISKFITLFSEKIKHRDDIKDESLHFSVLIYGDVFYRGRSYDVTSIAENADEVMIMAYDFHKSRGEPGPNFPLNGKDQYGYDFVSMIEDFQHVVPSEKLTVIFGMYGYNWTLGKQGLPLKPAQSQTLQNIRDSFLINCQFKSCSITRDKISSEQYVKYIDKEGYPHEVWFEDEESVEKKNGFLNQQGIGSMGYWVYGYF